jgi:hypothetical protein
MTRPGRHIRPCSEKLKQRKLDHVVDRAMRLHFLVQRAREVLPEDEAARSEHRAREEAEREPVVHARVAQKSRDSSAGAT